MDNVYCMWEKLLSNCEGMGYWEETGFVFSVCTLSIGLQSSQCLQNSSHSALVRKKFVEIRAKLFCLRVLALILEVSVFVGLGSV